MILTILKTEPEFDSIILRNFLKKWNRPQGRTDRPLTQQHPLPAHRQKRRFHRYGRSITWHCSEFL